MNTPTAILKYVQRCNNNETRRSNDIHSFSFCTPTTTATMMKPTSKRSILKANTNSIDISEHKLTTTSNKSNSSHEPSSSSNHHQRNTCSTTHDSKQKLLAFGFVEVIEFPVSLVLLLLTMEERYGWICFSTEPCSSQSSCLLILSLTP